MSKSKVSPALADRLAHAQADDWLDVVVALRVSDLPMKDSAANGKRERIAAAKEHFAEDSQPVLRAIDALGGQVIDRIWINQSLAVRLRASQVTELQAIEAVLLLDIARPLVREQIREQVREH